jgi:hypothetical protein
VPSSRTVSCRGRRPASRSWADDRFEITAAAMKALVAYDKDDPLLPKVVDFFAKTSATIAGTPTKDTAMIVCDVRLS